MDSVVRKIYIFPRQWFNLDGECFAGPPGLCRFGLLPHGEDGTYAAAMTSDSYLDAEVYATDLSYECFSPAGPWRAVGRLGSIRGVAMLAKRYAQITFDFPEGFIPTMTSSVFRTMYIMQAAPSVFYARVRSDRMPDDFYAVYRMYGISSVADWHRVSAVGYDGVMSEDEANATIAPV